MKELLRRFVRTCMTLFLRLRSRPYIAASGVRCVVVAPHQDDEALGCAGLIHTHLLAGLPVNVIYVTDGSGSHPNHPRLSPADLARLRRSEATRAMGRLGVSPDSLHFIEATDGTLSHLSPVAAEAITGRLAVVLKSLRPSLLLMPCRDDGSSEHTSSFTLTLRALDLARLKPRLLEYPVWARWSPLRLFRPGLRSRHVHRLSFPATHTLKLAALADYESQTQPTPPWSQPVMPAGFFACFKSAEEFFFERQHP